MFRPLDLPVANVCPLQLPRHSELHQATSGVIHIDKQRTTSSTLFEPLIVTAIDLNEFSLAGPAIARLMNTVALLPHGALIRS